MERNQSNTIAERLPKEVVFQLELIKAQEELKRSENPRLYDQLIKNRTVLNKYGTTQRPCKKLGIY